MAFESTTANTDSVAADGDLVIEKSSYACIQFPLQSNMHFVILQDWFSTLKRKACDNIHFDKHLIIVIDKIEIYMET